MYLRSGKEEPLTYALKTASANISLAQIYVSSLASDKGVAGDAGGPGSDEPITPCRLPGEKDSDVALDNPSTPKTTNRGGRIQKQEKEDIVCCLPGLSI